jgi:hypothetical protein
MQQYSMSIRPLEPWWHGQVPRQEVECGLQMQPAQQPLLQTAKMQEVQVTPQSSILLKCVQLTSSYHVGSAGKAA